MSVNKVILMGNVTSDIKVKTFEDGGKIASFGLATNKRGYKTKSGKDIPERTEFHNISVPTTGLAEVCEKYLKKGHKVYIEGELRTREYENNGQKMRITEIYADNLELLTPKASAQGQAPEQQREPEYDENGKPLPF